MEISSCYNIIDTNLKYQFKTIIMSMIDYYDLITLFNVLHQIYVCKIRDMKYYIYFLAL